VHVFENGGVAGTRSRSQSSCLRICLIAREEFSKLQCIAEIKLEPRERQHGLTWAGICVPSYVLDLAFLKVK
jgi:hypothetical protein